MKKFLIVLGGFFLGVILLAAAIFIITSLTSKKMTCKSNEGNITIMYNDDTLTGYNAVNLTYNLDQQKELAEEIGVDEYLNQFAEWFETNTTGTCNK